MNPKSGKAGSAVPPAAPEVAEEADVADPGEVAKVKAEQLRAKKGKYGSTQVKPFKPAQSDEDEESAGGEDARPTSWIEIELIDEDDQPVPGERYRLILPDGSEATGTLDNNGLARIDGIDPAGTCQIAFTNLDQEAWEWA